LPKDLRDTTTPEAMAGDLHATLVEGELSSESREKLRAWMVGCKTGLARLRKGLPAGWIVADKTGSGENGTSNDIAVAWRPGGAIVIACYLTGARAGPDGRDAAIADVGGVVATAFGDAQPSRD
jgi:beta-lactamase class A